MQNIYSNLDNQPIAIATTPSYKHKGIVPWIVSAGAIVTLLVGFFFVFIPTDSGMLVYNDADVEQVRAVLDIFLAEYSSLSDLIIAVFGAVAFLVSYQSKAGSTVTSRSWALLSAGIVFLTGALIISLLSREQLLTMAARNAIEYNLPALRFGRWAMYICLTVAAVMFGYFAFDVALAAKKATVSDD